jgi:hypothetical protein
MSLSACRVSPLPGLRPSRHPAPLLALTAGLAWFSLLALGATAAPATLPVPNPSFEEGEGMKPVGWTVFGGGDGARADLVGAPARTGARAARIEDRSEKVAVGWESGVIPVDAGETYRFSAYTSVRSGKLELYLQYYDAARKRIGVKTTGCPAGEGWQACSVSDRAPQGAVSCKLLFYSSLAGKAEAYCDDVALERVAGQQQPPPASAAPAPKTTYPLQRKEHPRVFFTAQDAVRFREPPFTPAEALLTQSELPIPYIAGKRIVYTLPPKEYREPTPPPGFAGAYPYWTGYASRVEGLVESLVGSYLATGDRRYATRIKEYLFALAEWASWNEIPSELSLSICHFTFGYALGYDAIHDTLDEAERARIREGLVRLSAEPILKAGLALVDHNITGMRHFAIGLAGLALLGEHPRAEACIDLGRRYSLWYLDLRTNTQDTEGLGYTDYVMGNIARLAVALHRVTGDRSLLDHPYLRHEYPEWLLYSLVPKRNGVLPFGDNHGAVVGKRALCLAADLHTNGQAGWLLGQAGLDRGLAFADRLLSNPQRVAKAPEGLSPDRHFERLGQVSLRQDWGTAAALVGFVCSASTAEHDHFHQNHLVLNLEGEWLLSDPGYRDQTKGWTAPEVPTWRYTVQSFGHNTALIDGKGQQVRGGGKILGYFSSPAFAYAEGEAAGAYDPSALTQFRRRLVFLRNAPWIVLFDELRSPAPSRFELLFHTGKPIQLDGTHATLTRSRSSLEIWALEPDGVGIGATRYPGAERYGPYLVVSNREPSPRAQFVTVLAPRLRSTIAGSLLFDFTRLNPTASSGQESKLVSAMGSSGLFYRGREGQRDFMAFDLQVPRAGRYTLTATYLRSPVYGQVELSIDGKVVGGLFEGYTPEPEPQDVK